MQTDLMFGAYVEVGDVLAETEEYPQTEVMEIEDDGPVMQFVLKDEDGEKWHRDVAAFDTVEVILSFEDEAPE